MVNVRSIQSILFTIDKVKRKAQNEKWKSPYVKY